MTDLWNILEKLEPIFPDKVVSWRRTLDIAESDVKEMLERQIRWTAYSIFGDFRKKLLLSLPPKKIAKGTFQLGTISYDKDYWPFGISKTELLSHFLIAGRSGSGKTNITFLLLEQLVKNKIHFLYLDWKRTARHLIPFLGKKLQVYTPGRLLSPFPFNPFIVPAGIEWKVYLNHLIDVLGDAYTLGDGAKSILQKTFSAFCSQGKTPLVSEALETLERMDTKGRATGWKTSAIRALESLEFTLIPTSRQKQELFTKSLIKKNTILELDSLSQSSKIFLIPFICQWIYSVMLASPEREKLKLVIFLEEAHHTVFRSDSRTKESLMNTLIRQCRELGISFVFVDQQPHLLSSSVLANCYCKLFLNLGHSADINNAATSAMVNEKDKHWFNRLPVGQGIVKLQDRWQRPFLVKFPLVPVEKGVVTDEILKQFVDEEMTLSQLRKRLNIKQIYTENVRKSKNEFPDDEARFRMDATSVKDSNQLLHDIVRHPDDGVWKRYDRLKVSVDKGNRWKRELVDRGLVIPEQVKVGRTNRVILRLSDKAKKMLSPKKNDRDGRAGFVHEYYKQQYVNKLSEAGFKTSMETPRRKTTGRADLIAAGLKQPNMVVEIETGKSDVVANVKQDLLEGYKKIIVAATDEPALEKVKRQLDEAGLLIYPRVTVVLRDQLEDSLNE